MCRGERPVSSWWKLHFTFEIGEGSFSYSVATEPEWLHDVSRKLTMIVVAENKYGKSRVRLVQVKRKAGLA